MKISMQQTRVTANGEMDEDMLVQDGLMCMVNKTINKYKHNILPQPWHLHRLHSYESINLFLGNNM